MPSVLLGRTGGRAGVVQGATFLLKVANQWDHVSSLILGGMLKKAQERFSGFGLFGLVCFFLLTIYFFLPGGFCCLCVYTCRSCVF